MNRITYFLNQLGDTLGTLNTADNWRQVIIVITLLAIAWTATRFFGRVLTRSRVGGHNRMRPLATRQTQRVVFPLLALLFVTAAYAPMQLLQVPVQLLRIAIILLFTLAGVRLLVNGMRRHFAPTPTLNAWVKVFSSLIWFAVLLYLSEFLPPLLDFLDKIAITIGETRISVLSAINFLILIAVLFSIAIWLSSHLERRLKESAHLSAGVRLALVKVTRIILIILAVVIALDAVGIGLTTLAVFSGAIGVGIGFGLQRTASNFITGFLLLFDRSVRPGDLIKVGERLGQVQELRARYIVLKDFDGVSTLIPNEHLITGEVVNWSYGDHIIRVRIPVDISYEDDPVKAQQLLINIAHENSRALASPPAEAQLISFGDNGIKLELHVWIDDPENGLTNLRSEINLRIWQEFAANHIHFPYPQHDIHVKAFPEGVAITPVK